MSSITCNKEDCPTSIGPTQHVGQGLVGLCSVSKPAQDFMALVLFDSMVLARLCCAVMLLSAWFMLEAVVAASCVVIG